MFAIIDIGGEQYHVQPGDVIEAPKMDKKEKGKLTIDRVLLLDTDQEVLIGTPKVTGAKVKAHVLEHGKEKKILVFKKKRRKDYKKLIGHRQDFTRIHIDDITLPKSKAAGKKAEPEPAESS